MNNMTFEQTFYDRLSPAPYCTNDFKYGLKIRSKKSAITFKNIQHNTPFKISSMVFDLDFADSAHKWEDANLPQPTWITINPENAHTHVGYMLKTPVHKGTNSSQKALHYFKTVNNIYASKLGSDINYNGLLTKNPIHSDWKSIISGKMYDLDELSEYIDLNIIPTKPEMKLGRNCELFDQLKQYAYRIYFDHMNDLEKFNETLRTYANTVNCMFPKPLGKNELESVIKSVHTWIVKYFNPYNFRNKQKNIRLYVGHKTRCLVQDASGTPKEIAEKLDISLSTVYRHKIKEKKQKPWEEMGISRSTYYRTITKE